MPVAVGEQEPTDAEAYIAHAAQQSQPSQATARILFAPTVGGAKRAIPAQDSSSPSSPPADFGEDEDILN
jgi:hypothetical protein